MLLRFLKVFKTQETNICKTQLYIPGVHSYVSHCLPDRTSIFDSAHL